MAEEVEKNWIDEMIERESIPQTARQGTVADFCAIWGVCERTYYYQSRKPEYQKESLRIALALVKKRTPEILERLAQKAEGGDMKATDMFLNYVLELSQKIDLTSKGEKIAGFNYIMPDDKDNCYNKTPTKTTPSLE